MAARIAMIAITTNSSIKVKPFLSVMTTPPLVFVLLLSALIGQ